MATIAINLDDKASAGLQGLTGALNKTATAAEGLDENTAALNDEQQRQIVLVQRAEQDWKTFGSTVATAAGQANVEIAKMVTRVTELANTTVHAVYGAEQFAFSVGNKVVSALTSAGLIALKYTLLTKGAVEVIKTVKGSSDEAAASIDKQGDSYLSTAAKATAAGVVLTTVTGKWNSAGQAATSAGIAAVRAFTVAGPAITAGTVLLSGYQAVMARTGISVDALGNKTSNLDRVGKAFDGLASDARTFGGEMISALKDTALAAIPLRQEIGAAMTKAWKDFDTVATRTADNNIKSINNIRAAMTGVPTAQREATEKLEAQREKEKAGFENLRKYNEDLAASEKTRARTSELTSITTIEGLEKEITAVRNKAAAEAQAGRDNKSQIDELNILEQQRTKIIQAEEAARTASASRSLAIRKQLDEDYAKGQQIAADQRVKQAQKEFDDQKKVLEDYYAFRRNLANDARNGDIATAEALIRQSGDEAKARANLLEGDKKAAALKQADRDTANALHALKMKQIDEELRQALAGAKTEDEQRKAFYDNERKRATAEADFNRQVMIQKLQDRQAESERAISIEKEKQDKLKAATKENLGKAGFDPQAMLQQANQRDVLRALQQQARDRAKQYVNQGNQDLVNEAMTDHGGQADQKLRRLQAQAQNDAAAEAARRFRFGKTDPNDLANAQAQVVNQTLALQGQQGNVTNNALKVMQDEVKATAANAAAIQAQQQTIDQLQRQVAAVLGGAQAGQQRARAQANSQ